MINLSPDKVLGDDVAYYVMHGLMSGKMTFYGLSVAQILSLKHWYEMQTGKRAENIDV